MDKEENYSATFTSLDYSLDHHHHHHHHHQQQQQQHEPRIGEASSNNGMIDYMLNNPHQPSSGFCTSTSLDKLSFADVMQFADFGPKLGLNQNKVTEDDTGIDPVYFLKFPVLTDNKREEEESLMVPQENNEEEKARVSDNISVQLQFLENQDVEIKNPIQEVKNKRKRPRSIKTSEEVESQRMTHIAVERNRRKQMNEHLRVLRSLMPGSYVQRDEIYVLDTTPVSRFNFFFLSNNVFPCPRDQASIIGGAIEFVRELEQLLQCLESQKRRRLYGDQGGSRQMGGGDASLATIQQPQSPFFPPVPLPNDQMEFDTGLREETAENKSCLADVEVKLLGFDAMIKILSRRRPGQLIKTIAALEDLQLNILHTNITTIEQTVLYSFNVKIASESRFTAEDIASSVQQIFSFIHANSSM